MDYKIVVDSGCDINKSLEEQADISVVPLTIYIDEKEYKDDANMDQKELLKHIKKSSKAPRTASPSPEDFSQAYEGNQSVFVVTLSSRLSATYQSAKIASKMEIEKNKGKFIHVFDSLSASVGETLVSMKIFELIKQNLAELEIVDKVNTYINEMKTFFVLESLDTLIKAGRINSVVGMLATALNMKPIMGSTDEGTIKLVEKIRGSQRAFKRLVDIIGETGEKLEQKVLGIAHCNCLSKALEFKEEVMKRYNFKDIVIVEMRGIATVYANEGGLVIAF